MMAINRRQFLIGAGGLAAAATTMGLGACAPGSQGGGSQGGGGEGGATDLALAWWGNPTRNKNTEAMIAAYTAANPNVKISGQPGEFSGYWDKLATQTAGGTAPDIIQMDMAYIAEYGTRGALLDLGASMCPSLPRARSIRARSTTSWSELMPASTARSSLPTPRSSRRPRWKLPDDKTWTWDQLSEVAAEVASKAGVPFGLAGLVGSDAAFALFLRQNGKELFTPDGLGFEVADAQAWYDLMVKFQKAKAIGTPEQISEEGQDRRPSRWTRAR